LPRTEIAKLSINGDPGSGIIGDLRDYCRTFKNQQEISVKGLHLLTEDSPHEIGGAIAH